ncbi:phage upper tail fiber protein [Sinorhizobium meliloti]|uniref:phage upper tail fiber protein n=1 Tax=Rhizobium meliloti TaxID=382 RepID=UPI000FDAAF30|nr:hypothetical protein [Sinorhizobium meliloti]RVP95734.1 hypothetical protein CN070_27445 [Sinorhizobium meliloti]
MATANEIWRDFNVDGVPSSGPYDPEKSLIREWGMQRVGSTSVSTIVKLTQAQYNALGTKDANTLYIIIG